MSGPYKRRKSAGLIRNFWVYRWLIFAAIVLGTLLWFILINSQQVTVFLPFGLGRPSASIGLIVLFSAGVGALAAVCLTALFLALHKKDAAERAPEPDVRELPDDRPPSDYAAKTPEGFSDAPWSAR
jgi:uncharacterized integral membrane protein